MSILCIETGTDVCSVALARDGRCVALRHSGGERDHAARVGVYAAKVMAEAGVAVTDLRAVAVSQGPGSYTGLRIGTSFAKGLCYGLGIPLVGVGSLDSLCEIARRSASNGFFVPMIDARRMEVYGQVFDAAGVAQTPVEAWIIDENSLAHYRDKKLYIFGNGAEKCRQLLPWTTFLDVAPSAEGMIPLAERALAEGRGEDVAYFEPFYLKDFVVTTSAKKLL